MTPRNEHSPKLHVTVYADAHPNHLAYVYTGLCDLAYQGKIVLDFTFPWSRLGVRPAYGDVTLQLKLSEAGSKTVTTVVFDLHDKSDKFIRPRLEECDVYFKRSYYRHDVEKLGETLKQKVVPFGLCYPCKSLHDKALFQRTLGFFYARRSQHVGLFWRDTVEALFLLRQHYRSPIAGHWLAGRTQTRKPWIIFQTMVYAPSETTDDAHSINEFRVQIIRALKKRFKGQFHGGLVPSKYALGNYADCIATSNTKRNKYLGMLMNAAIGVYTRGLHHSIAWKLAEYLGAGLCIVAEPLRNQLPRPLTSEKNYIPFTTPEQCVAACEELLQDEARMLEMARVNSEYYWAEVDPATRVWSCLLYALQTKYHRLYGHE